MTGRMIRFLKPFLTPKNEYCSDLKYRLLNFSRRSNGDFAPRRRTAYQTMQQFLLDNRKANVHADGLKCVFYARYYSSYYFIVNNPEPSELKTFVETKRPDRLFKELADKEINRTLTMEIDKVSSHDSYDEVLQNYFRDANMVKEFKRMEKVLMEPINESRFNQLNDDTLEYTKRLVNNDCRRLEKTGVRLKMFATENKILIPLIGIFTQNSVDMILRLKGY
jgi:hypothetical protein